MTEAQDTEAVVASVIICTYRRDEVLTDTIEYLLPQVQAQGVELIVVDQLAQHPVEVQQRLDVWSAAGRIRYVNLERSGLPHARNVGARMAASDILLYLDDDIVPGDRLVASHVANYRDDDVAAVAGQVLDPGREPTHAPGFFYHDKKVERFRKLYGANFSVRRSAYEQVGGADENQGVHASSEDRILADRLTAAGLRIRYDPDASVLHLTHGVGGCRITDETQPTSESEKVFGTLYWLFVSREGSWEQRREALWGALRQGPLRKQNVMRPWRQPMVWWSFGQATLKAYRRAREGSPEGGEAHPDGER